MRLYIIRHGESANNALASVRDYDEYMTTRSPDPPLTDVGRIQADRIAAHLAADCHPENGEAPLGDGRQGGYNIQYLFCSAMLRALETAFPIGRALGLEPEVWLDIHEHGGIFFGNPRNDSGVASYPGLSRQAIVEQFPGFKVPLEISETGWWSGGYEEIECCEARALHVAQTLRSWAADRYNTANIALVSHGTFVDRLLKALFGQDLDTRQVFFQHYNTAVTRVDFRPDGPLVLRYLNRTQHLPPELTTS